MRDRNVYSGPERSARLIAQARRARADRVLEREETRRAQRHGPEPVTEQPRLRAVVRDDHA